MRAAVVGAGIAGLTSAWRLKQAGWEVEVFEASDHAGGRVETVGKDGYLLDTGATAIAARYPIFTALATELGLEIVPTAPYLGVVRDGRIRLLRLDRLVSSGLRTDLLSPLTKLRLVRVVLDIVVNKLRGRLDYDDLRRAAPLDTETARDYLVRLAGHEADAYLGEPITRALLLADSDQVSRVELMSGLINAVAGSLGALAGGQAAVIDALVDRVGAVRLGTRVESVVESAGGVEVRSSGPDGGTRTEHFDACVVACPVPEATRICPGQRDRLAPLNDRLTFTRAINVSVGSVRAPDTPAFLLQLPRSEDREIGMIIVESNKAADRAPSGHGLFTLSWEMSAAAAWYDRSDEEIVTRTLTTLERVFGDLGVELTYVRRWPLALPHTRPGVYRAIADFTEGLDAGAAIQFAGDWLSQTGQNTAVAWGERAARNLVARCGP
ncbi:MAG TPA: FAD-dependent oxidoreductase [Pseudonocardia sp.]|jgi:oxygen-dependent protoporphyrinogen oxidase|nr:FAD-dependent oxidoreductase [Pseudonocardia sp.]